MTDNRYTNRSDGRGSAGQSADCNPHPDAPHGFDRTASLNEDRYVCDCESWSETNRADDSLRTRIAAVIHQYSVPIPMAELAADAVIRELTNPIRGCTDPWHWEAGEPYRCPSCGYWMGEGYV